MLRIVVSGYIGRYPLGGVAWDYIQFVAGLHRLGHDVYYVEDSGHWPYNPRQQALTDDCSFTVRHIDAVMRRFGLQDRWAYLCPFDKTWWGIGSSRVAEVMRTADLLVNVSGSLQLESLSPFGGRAVFIDSDPIFTQVKLSRGHREFERLVEAHDVHFSFGETLAQGLFGSQLQWRPTRQPVLLDDWDSHQPPGSSFTTVMNWTSYRPVQFNGQSYGQKDQELRRFLDLPRAVEPIQLELALAAGRTDRAPYDLLRRHGWRLADPDVVCADIEAYARYIKGSRGEWSVAKNAYVVGAPGWFSCRSACYLAAGRPVVVQDTGFPEVIPTGLGVVAFEDAATAAQGVRDVDGDWARHSTAARELAAEYFDARRVLARLLDEAFAERSATAVSEAS
jgi:hypothetical protein